MLEKAARRHVILAVSLIATLAFGMSFSPSMVGAGGPPVRGRHPAIRSVQTVRQAIDLCSNHVTRTYRARVHGVFLLELGPGLVNNQGAIFDTVEVPISAPYNDNVRFYGGMAVTLQPSVYARRLSTRSPFWVVLSGTLHCTGPYLVARSWRSGVPGPIQNIPSLKRRLTPRSALRLCRTRNSARYRVRVRGFYRGIDDDAFTNGALFESRVPSNAPQYGVLAYGGLPVVPSAAYRARSDIPNGRWVTVTGLLACKLRPGQLEAYIWQAVSAPAKF
ncbi:MAG: hypothetical protein ACRDFX_11110 [Chloroflexota bacterium]